LALDLVNTRPRLADGVAGDLLASPADLRSWLALQADRIPDAAALGATDRLTELGQADVAAVHAVREHAAAAINGARLGHEPPEAAMRGLNQALRAAPAIKELAWNGTAVTVAPRRKGPLGVRVAAHLAEVTADLLADPAIVKVRECEADDCLMLFLPAHPRRRWCSTSRCGNRVRVARYYQRHKKQRER
jgi:predicted RNA-binding Zn ribbon-like protein